MNSEREAMIINPGAESVCTTDRPTSPTDGLHLESGFTQAHMTCWTLRIRILNCTKWRTQPEQRWRRVLSSLSIMINKEFIGILEKHKASVLLHTRRDVIFSRPRVHPKQERFLRSPDDSEGRERIHTVFRLTEKHEDKNPSLMQTTESFSDRRRLSVAEDVPSRAWSHCAKHRRP